MNMKYKNIIKSKLISDNKVVQFSLAKIFSGKKLKYNTGSTMIATTIIVLFTALVIAVSIQYQSIGELVMSYGDQQSEQSFELAQSCINEALMRVKTNNNYTGGSYVIGSGSCVLSVSGSGATRTLSISATVGQSIRKIIANISISATDISITGWKEDIS